MSSRPSVVVTRRLPEAVEREVAKDFDARLNPDDKPLGPDGLKEALRSADALLCTVTDKLTADVLAAEPRRAQLLANFGVFATPERNLVFDLMVRTPNLLVAADGLADHDALTVVVEHTGWPVKGTDEEFAEWKNGLDALASVGPNVVCKLSGLAMPLGAMSVDALQKWIDFALDVFGVDRCMFASNFPVDGLHGSLDQLWSTYDALTADYSEADRDKLFATNAERVYRI